MGTVRTLGLATAVKGTPTPAVLAAAYYTSSNLATPGVVIPAVSFTIKRNIASIFLTAATLPTIGYNGPNGYIPIPTASPATATQSQNAVAGQPFNIFGGTAPGSGNSANGQKVCLWGFTTATYFNGKVVTVLDNNPVTGEFRFFFKHADVANTADTGNTAPCPAQHYRAIRLECSQSLGTDLIYVGDLNVSSSQYSACLSLTGQLAIEIVGENIPPESICIDTSGTSSNDAVMVSVIY
jgi:hypothetical protein